MKNKKKNNLYKKLQRKFGVEKLGLMSGKRWREDPKGLLFSLSRYKFVSKLLNGKNEVLEIGCGDGWYSRIVKQSVKNLTISDVDEVFLNSAKSREKNWRFKYLKHNMLEGPQKKNMTQFIYLMFLSILKKKMRTYF